MAALATRAFVAAGGDFYLCPLSAAPLSRAERHALLRPAWEGTQALEPVGRPGPQGQPDELVAEGLAGLRDQWAGASVGAGGVGVPGAVPDRG